MNGESQNYMSFEREPLTWLLKKKKRERNLKVNKCHNLLENQVVGKEEIGSENLSLFNCA